MDSEIAKNNEILPPTEVQEKELVSSEQLTNIYSKVAVNLDNNTNEVSDVLDKFLDMVINGGDASSSTKEAVVNLLKIKCDINDQAIKLADLMTRVKMKERNTIPPGVFGNIKAYQNNFNFGKEEENVLLDEIEKATSRIKRKNT